MATHARKSQAGGAAADSGATPVSLRYRKIAAETAARLLAAFPDDIQAIVLYGSVARGDANEHSDIDLLVITPDDDCETRYKIDEIAYDVSWERDNIALVQLMMMPEDGFETEAITYRSYFGSDIMEQGVALHDDGAYQRTCDKARGLRCVPTAPAKEFVARQMELAREYLNDSVQSLEMGSLRTAIDRAYYAMHHSAVALLCHLGVRPPRSHAGLMSVFGQEVVNKGVMPREFGPMLRRANRARMAGTYSPYANITESLAQANVNNARLFVDRVADALNESGLNESAPNESG